MRKFKHIPTGKIATVDYKNIPSIEIDGVKNLFPVFLLESGSDWKEIHWEVTQFRIVSDTFTAKKGDIVKAYHMTIAPEQMIADPVRYEIYSIRRLLDGEVFTIGDLMSAGCGVQKIIKITFDKPDRVWLHYFSSQQYTHSLEEAKKVKPKEWEITSFKSIADNFVYLMDGMYRTSKRVGGYWLREMLDRPHVWNIHSIKRLSDGVEFTIGNIVEATANKIFKINKFVIVDGDKIHIDIAEDYYTELSYLKKVEWEITAYQNNNNGVVRPDKRNEADLIYSVKRLSDGVEFKIGDRFHPNNTVRTPRVIEYISIISNRIAFNHGGSFMSHSTKAEKLFTTEDGVDIYEGETYYYVNTNTFRIDNTKAFTKPENVTNDYYKNHKEFSTKEAAEEYVLMNKPCLSLADVATIYPTAGMKVSNYKQTLKIRELVKSKLK
jgi:hypothetical protein